MSNTQVALGESATVALGAKAPTQNGSAQILVAALLEVGGAAANTTSLNGNVPKASLASDVVSVELLGSSLSQAIGVTVSTCLSAPRTAAGCQCHYQIQHMDMETLTRTLMASVRPLYISSATS
jgi:hypothetical protein